MGVTPLQAICLRQDDYERKRFYCSTALRQGRTASVKRTVQLSTEEVKLLDTNEMPAKKKRDRSGRKIAVIKAKGMAEATPCFYTAQMKALRLDSANVLCLPAFGALDDVEFNALAFLERTETVCLDGCVMHEYILAVVAAKEAESLC